MTAEVGGMSRLGFANTSKRLHNKFQLWQDDEVRSGRYWPLSVRRHWRLWVVSGPKPSLPQFNRTNISHSVAYRYGIIPHFPTQPISRRP